jgi:hypothetical protein
MSCSAYGGLPVGPIVIEGEPVIAETVRSAPLTQNSITGGDTETVSGTSSIRSIVTYEPCSFRDYCSNSFAAFQVKSNIRHAFRIFIEACPVISMLKQHLVTQQKSFKKSFFRDTTNRSPIHNQTQILNLLNLSLNISQIFSTTQKT